MDNSSLGNVIFVYTMYTYKNKSYVTKNTTNNETTIKANITFQQMYQQYQKHTIYTIYYMLLC